MEGRPLPEPGSDELNETVTNAVSREIYALLYRRRSANPPTMLEIEHYMRSMGVDQNHTGRRVRELRRWFDIPAERLGAGDPRYRLAGWSLAGVGRSRPNISKPTRAKVLAPGRCAMCGKTPLGDGVKLVVDHKVPQAWGGGDEIENLQPLCEECNDGKKAWFATYEASSDEIRAAINHDEVHRRIGELLKAFHGKPVFTELIGIVASAQAFQEDYQKRLRELRTLGWDIKAEKRHDEGTRVRTYYRCLHWEPWPDGPIITEIHRREKAKKAAKAQSTEARQ